MYAIASTIQVPAASRPIDGDAVFGDAAGVAYPGGKEGGGAYHTLINLMPPHPVYIEPFLGGGAVLRRKLPAPLNIGLDLDAKVISRWKATPPSSVTGNGDHRGGAVSGPGRSHSAAPGGAPRFHFVRADAIGFLASYPFTGAELVYCDPPYVMESRKCQRRYYEHEMTDEQHRELLEILRAIDCRVMVSGYWTELYANALNGWNLRMYEATVRAGQRATEYVWFNFPPPVELHDYRYLGTNRRERWNLTRKKRRWIGRLESMPALERQALLAAIAETSTSAGDGGAVLVAGNGAGGHATKKPRRWILSPEAEPRPGA